MSSFRLAVLNPGGRDPNQSFSSGAGTPDAAGHAPVNFHAYAACTNGEFLRDAARIPHGSNVLLLCRSDMTSAVKALRVLRHAGCKVLASLKECGLHQTAGQLSRRGKLALFKEILASADGALAATPETETLFRALGAKEARFVPTPYPVDVPAWDFAQPQSSRRGILVGTRELDVPSRNHLLALTLIRPLVANSGEPLILFTPKRQRRHVREILTQLGYRDDAVQIHEAPLPYAEYLKVVAGARLVFQLDRSAVPGQVAGDCLLAGTPCVGGDGAVDRVAFPDWHGFGKSPAACVEIAETLWADPQGTAAEMNKIRERAAARLGFRVTAKALEDWLQTI